MTQPHSSVIPNYNCSSQLCHHVGYIASFTLVPPERVRWQNVITASQQFYTCCNISYSHKKYTNAGEAKHRLLAITAALCTLTIDQFASGWFGIRAFFFVLSAFRVCFCYQRRTCMLLSFLIRLMVVLFFCFHDLRG